MAKKLEVNDLRISFRTNSGILEAVRGISFDLEEGETLAIVGESGSGKSVTSRAIMGILAKNSIVEGGEIFYSGLDLLQISEDTFHQLRGNNISMIFQDPLSSLNPIMRVGQQMTEAMVANNKSRRKEATRNLNQYKKAIQDAVLAANPNSPIKDKMGKFTGYLSKSNKLAEKYFNAHSAAETTSKRVQAALIEVQGTDDKRIENNLDEVVQDLKRVHHPLTITEKDKEFLAAEETLRTLAPRYASQEDPNKKAKVTEALEVLDRRLNEVLERDEVDFPPLGYAISKSSEEEVLRDFSHEKNIRYKQAYETEFLNSFRNIMEEGIVYEDNRAREAVKKAHAEVTRVLNENRDSFDINRIKKEKADLSRLVEDTINRVSVHRDSLATTFKASLENHIENYESQKRKVNSKHKVTEKEGSLTPQEKLSIIEDNILRLFARIQGDYESRLENKRDAKAHAETYLRYLEKQANTQSYKIDKDLAETRAVAIMQEVGIDNARRRFKQYPFEFSGGMRQRIVIAIALSSNPDILICDEPTTALDVTIQAQILDLIKELKVKRNLSVIFITHDLGVVANIADKIAVMYAGKIVEIGAVEEVFYKPAHPYTWALLSSMPDLETKEKLESIPGVPPNMVRAPKGDAFAERNRYALAIDYEEHPPFFEISKTHKAATWLLHPSAPKVEPPKIVTERINRSLSRGDANE